MPRKPQEAASKGSQRWLQAAVNRCPTVIDSEIRNTGIHLDNPIVWTSPLESDEFAEYWDTAFLKQIGVSLHRPRLGDFWPNSGPRWDALARSGDTVLLIEAKANLDELNSPECKATAPESLAKIHAALEETRAFLKVESDTDWTRCFYQYANRLAHLYLLRELNGYDAHLVFVYFVDDHTKERVSRSGWRAAVALAKAHLGLPKRSEWMSRYVKDAYIDTADLSHVDWPP